MAKDVAFGKNLSFRLRKLAKTNGGQRALARKAGVEIRRLQAAISREANPGADLISKVCAASSCSAHWLLTGEGEMFEDKRPCGPGVEERRGPGLDTKEGIRVLGTIIVARAGDAGMQGVPEGSELYVDVSRAGRDGDMVAVCVDSLVVARRIAGGKADCLLVPDPTRRDIPSLSPAEVRIIGVVTGVWTPIQ